MHRRKKKKGKPYLHYVIAILGYFFITALLAVWISNLFISTFGSVVTSRLVVLGIFFVASWTLMFVFLKYKKLI